MKKEVLVKFYSTYKLYIFPAAVAISCLILIIFVIFPQLGKLLSNNKVATELRSKADFLEVKAQVLEGLDGNDLSSKLNYALLFFPAEKDFTNALGLLQNITSQSSFSILSFALGTQTAVKGAQSYLVKLEVRGPKFLLPQLLSSIENSDRLMRVSSIEVNLSPDESVNAFLGIDALYLSAPASFGTTDSPLPTLTQADEQLITTLVRAGEVGQQPSVSTPGVPLGKSNPFE